MSSSPRNESSLITIPREVQVHMLTFLRAFDLSAVQQTCRFYNNEDLIHSVVTHVADQVYTPELTKDVVKSKKGKYTLDYLRSIELTVVARVLSLPEPKNGFYVSIDTYCTEIPMVQHNNTIVSKRLFHHRSQNLGFERPFSG